MIEWVYRFLARLSRFGALQLVRVTAAIVAAGYFVLLPRRLGRSVRFYRALFPERSVLHALLCAWRQYQDFASLYYERLEIVRRSDMRFERYGEQHITEARAAGRGAILIMSHFGRWEIGARLFAKWQKEMTLVMGGQAGGGTRAGVDENLRSAGLDVVTVPEGRGHAFDILQAVQVLRRGGIVSLAGDRAFGDARRLRLPFLGRTAAVAAAPFALALASGASLLVVFALKLGPHYYRFTCDAPIALTAANRGDRQRGMEHAASLYLQRLHEMVKAHPEQWQGFEESFFGG